MTRTPRPSEVYRLPPTGTEPGPPPGSRQRRRLPFVAAAAAVALVAAFALTAGPPEPAARGPVVVAREDGAVAALGLYLTQQEATEALGGLTDILRPPGPDGAAREVAAQARAVERALRAARTQQREPGAAPYWSDHAHDAFVHRLEELADLASGIALLTAVHDTLYAGAGLIRPDEAEHALVSRFRAARPSPPPLAEWSDTLLAQLDGRDMAAQAAESRSGAARYWSQAAATVAPAAVESLQSYVGALPEGLVEALRGHPVGGPALQRLRAEIAFEAHAV